jgi:hypothetical protein
MGWMPKNDEPIQLNGAFYLNTTILRFVVASTAEAKLGALFHKCQDGIIFQQTLADLGHPQPQTSVHCDNAMAVGIANNTRETPAFVIYEDEILMGGEQGSPEHF